MKIKTRRYYFYYLLRVGVFLASLLPVRVTYLLGRFVGKVVFFILPHFRNKAIKHLKMAFPEKSEKEILEIAFNNFANIHGNFAELIHIPKMNADSIEKQIIIYGEENIKKVLSEGKGAIGMTGHFGNWELIGPVMSIKGYKAVTVARKLYFYKYDNFVRKLREGSGTETIDREESPKKMLKVLRDNKILGILADQDIDNIEGVFVNFFGRPAYTPTSPVKLAMASGAPLVPCYMLRDKGKYHCFIEKPIYVKSGRDREKAVKDYTQKWTDVLESYIRRYPDQWVWIHERWKTKPKAENEV